MKLDNSQLAAFAAVLREGSFETAAKRLHVTPSAISQRIRQLEDKLGQVLLQRSTPCQATAAGKTLARFTEQLSLLEGEMLQEVGSSTLNEHNVLRLPIVVNADSMDGWFLQVFDAMPPGHGMNFEIQLEDQDHSAALLREGSVMAAVSANPIAVQGCEVQALGAMRYLAVAAPEYLQSHFAAGVNAHSLSLAPILAFNQKDALQHRFMRLLCAEIGDEMPVPPCHYIPTAKGFVEVAKRGLGWGMMPEHFVQEALLLGTLRELAPGHYLDIPLYWHRWRIKSHALDTLSKAVMRAAAHSLRSASA